MDLKKWSNNNSLLALGTMKKTTCDVLIQPQWQHDLQLLKWQHVLLFHPLKQKDENAMDRLSTSIAIVLVGQNTVQCMTKSSITRLMVRCHTHSAQEQRI